MKYTILPAAASHLPYLPGIEAAAGELFPIEDLPEPVRAVGLSMADFERAQKDDLLWVMVDADDIPIAFLMAKIVDGYFHIAEFDVHPAHSRKGLGTQFLRHVLKIARQRDFEAATLTTFEHLPWNAPFYAKHGFRILAVDELEHGLAQILASEAEHGLKRRVAMLVSL